MRRRIDSDLCADSSPPDSIYLSTVQDIPSLKYVSRLSTHREPVSPTESHTATRGVQVDRILSRPGGFPSRVCSEVVTAEVQCAYENRHIVAAVDPAPRCWCRRFVALGRTRDHAPIIFDEGSAPITVRDRNERTKRPSSGLLTTRPLVSMDRSAPRRWVCAHEYAALRTGYVCNRLNIYIYAFSLFQGEMGLRERRCVAETGKAIGGHRRTSTVAAAAVASSRQPPTGRPGTEAARAGCAPSGHADPALADAAPSRPTGDLAARAAAEARESQTAGRNCRISCWRTVGVGGIGTREADVGDSATGRWRAPANCGHSSGPYMNRRRSRWAGSDPPAGHRGHSEPGPAGRTSQATPEACLGR